MNGAESLMRTLLAGGVDLCLMNPGTSEMQFVSALDRVPEMRGVLCLVEGVCAGAADGYARMTGRPAATLLHLGPGLANALSNLHNARKARSPVVNIVGEHSTQHLPYDAPLTANIEAIAGPVSDWCRTLDSAQNLGALAAEAIRAAHQPPGAIATLIIPADFSWSEAGPPGPQLPFPARSTPPGERIRAAAAALRSGKDAAIFLGGSALQSAGLKSAAEIAASVGAKVFANRYAARMTRGGNLPIVPRLAYFPEPAEVMLAGVKHLILVEAEPPVSFFGYPGRRSTLAPFDCEMHVLASRDQDGPAALAALAAELGAARLPEAKSPWLPPPLPEAGPLTLTSLGKALAALLPEGCVVSDEMVSSGEPVSAELSRAAQHDLLPVTGGSIGQGLPVALGAALACPGRTVVALEADGSGMYSLQALWTIARERLDVITVVFANRRYRILEMEMRRTGSGDAGPRADTMMDIGTPRLDWVRLAEGLGVAAGRAARTEDFCAQFEGALRDGGPRLIEAVLPGSAS